MKLISSSQQKPIMDESSMSLLKFFLDGEKKYFLKHGYETFYIFLWKYFERIILLT